MSERLAGVIVANTLSVIAAFTGPMWLWWICLALCIWASARISWLMW